MIEKSKYPTTGNQLTYGIDKMEYYEYIKYNTVDFKFLLDEITETRKKGIFFSFQLTSA